MRRVTPAWTFVLPLAFFVTLGTWALTSPAGSSPDDDYHLSSIWCAGGERDGVCERQVGDPDVRLLPESVARAHQCFAFDPTATGACTESLGPDVVATDRVNDVQELYPGGFYRTMGLLVGPDIDRSVLTMRIVNAALASLLLALALRVLSPAIRSSVVAVVLVVYVPLGLFIVPSTNPSSWTITGVTFLWAFGLAFAGRRTWRSRRTWVLLIATVISAALAIGSRVDGAAYVALVVAVIAILTGFTRLRRAWIASTVLAGLALVGLVRFLTFGAPGSGVSGGMGGTEPGIGLLLTNIVFLPVYGQGAVGGMPLGWNDTVLPPLVPVFGTLALGGLIYRGLNFMTLAKAIATLAALSALLAVPLVFLQREGLGVGEVVQARYLLPLIIVFVATISLSVPYRRNPGLPMPSAFGWVLFVGMASSAGLSLWVNAHRYAAGTSRGLFDIDLQIEWTGLSSIPLPAIVGIGVVATIIYAAAATSGIRRDGEGDHLTGRMGSPTTASRLEP